jgi:hypothetical protein
MINVIYKELFGNNIKADIDEIKKEIDGDSSIVFVYSGKQMIYDYINDLYDNGKGLNADYLYKFKICYEKTDLEVSYSAKDRKRSGKISSMSSLINELDGKNSCKIVVETNDRVQLAFIVQQLIFIEYPLEKVDIILKKEEKDAAKTKRFMEEVDKLLEDCEKTLERLDELKCKVETEMDDNNPTKTVRLKDINDTIDSCSLIRNQILKAKDVELKFAVAASKKAGKSVIVNCFLGEQIAPTSTELATPNNCFYKKSPDNMYHLQLEGGEQQDFDTRGKIYNVINEHFRTAQNDKEDGFALPDMHIGYVTEENNFSSYTISDTAGPDAAGTNHAEVAEKAMQKCDVAVFAIDYSKYLTKTEEEYLHHIKEMFTSQNKFHSLIFALNKIDVRYTDTESPKSFVMSVDFIKNRLAKIDEAYSDCIIFPTCSLEYFSAIEAEKAGITELNADNNLPIGEMKRVKFEHKDVSALAWLHTHSENLEYYHGMQTISYDVFKKDSGMLALMSYVSYVAQSKARDEIVNNVTFEISSQKMKIKSVIDSVDNLEALINADDEQISKISNIITEYSDTVQEILSEEFNQDELNELPINSLLRKFGGDYNKFIEHQRESLIPICEKISIAEAMYSSMVEAIWKKIEGFIERFTEIDGKLIDKLFTTNDFKELANQIGKQRVEQAAQSTFEQLSKLGREVKVIAGHRQDLLNKESINCRERLEKEHINLELPESPDFEFATKMTPPSEVVVSVGAVDFKIYDRLSSLFKRKFLSNIGIFFGNLFEHNDDKDYKLSLLASKKEFLATCDQELKMSFKNIVYENNIAEGLSDELTKSVVDKYMNDFINALKQTFENMNSSYMSYIERFRSAVDDRGKYETEIELYNIHKENIMAISECTKGFMDRWNSVISGLVEDEENKEIEKNLL